MEIQPISDRKRVGPTQTRREAETDTGVLKKGASAPLGATVYSDGVNFSLFSRTATQIELLLFDDENAAKPAKIVPLDPNRNRTYHYWHVFLQDLKPGQIYAYRAHGPFAPELGFRFDAEKVLIDPRRFKKEMTR